jgi:hypothetical protein
MFFFLQSVHVLVNISIELMIHESNFIVREHLTLDQIIAAVKDRFQVLHKQLGAAGFAKQDLLVEQRGRMKDLRTLSTSMLARVRAVRAEASDTACVTSYTELMGDLRTMAVPALPVAAVGGAALAVEVLEAPVSTAADLSVTLDATGVLAAIGSLGAVHVRCGMFMYIVFILGCLCTLYLFCLFDTHVLLASPRF